jgi:hypothetical protein
VFGRAIGGFGRGQFVIEGRALFFIESDPGGDACHLLSGFCQEIVEHTLGAAARVMHTHCQAKGDALCRWEAEVAEAYTTVATDRPQTEIEACRTKEPGWLNQAALRPTSRSPPTRAAT